MSYFATPKHWWGLDDYLNIWALEHGMFFVPESRHEIFKRNWLRAGLGGHVFMLRRDAELIVVDSRRPRLYGQSPRGPDMLVEGLPILRLFATTRVALADPASLDTILSFVGEFDANDCDR
jgi:hypothetical protein